MDDQVLELVAVDLGFLFVGEIAVLQPPAGDAVGHPVGHLLERGLALRGAEGPAEVLLGEDVGGVDAPGLGHLDAQLLEGDGAVAVVRDARVTALPAHLVVGVDALGGEVPADADPESLGCDCHVLSPVVLGVLVESASCAPHPICSAAFRLGATLLPPEPQHIVVGAPPRHEMLGFITAL